ncbi:hypothetical protein HGH93_27080 [Chitinophaga polysaccharea]|uniref:hypothetical protein n=1 Tax=Chitinophaga TaxID=79328 RepID=UPI0014554C19|nr:MULTISPECIES: hypothetical protein [Chitinophaga]NLR61789.1 hypothetical protein [Chitinophaga polysaccharea]NLU92658.1 hypothetical protein [Chitinophaga sp. Ak27]
MVLKIKKKWASLVTTLVLMVFTVSAQNKETIQDGTPEQRAKILTEWMKTNLALSAVQTEQVYHLNLQYAQKNALISQSKGGKLSKYKKMKALQQEKSASFTQILNTEQYKKYQELKEQMLKAIKEKRK